MYIRLWKTKLRRASYAAILVATMLSFGSFIPLTDAVSTASVNLPFTYDFHVNGILGESSSSVLSTSPYWWLNSGGRLTLQNGIGNTIQHSLAATDPVRVSYAAENPVATDQGYHPQNVFQMLFRTPVASPDASIYVKRNADNLTNATNRHAWNGDSILANYINQNNYYYAGIRNDGVVVIKKKTNGVFQTLSENKIFPGTYNVTSAPDLIPLNQWIGMRFVIATNSAGNPDLSFYTDLTHTGAWTLAAHAVDTPAQFGAPLTGSGLVGVENDFADASFDNFTIGSVGTTTAGAPIPAPGTSYDTAVLADSPVMYLAMSGSGTESDKTGHDHNGTYQGSPSSATLPNGDKAADFNGSSQYLTVPSSSALSISTTRALTWEAWIRPDTLQFANATSDGYVDWMGKCQQYSPTCEWESRIYSASTAEGRPDRLSAYVFNPSAGLGSAADWQPTSGLMQAGQWLHVVGEYQTASTPSGCSSSYPGSINIWVNGVAWNPSSHFPTGCMSQYGISPKASTSPLTIGTMAMDTWFKGAVGKVAVYNYLLSQSQINNHFHVMTNAMPSGSCNDTCTIPMPTP